MTQPDRQEPVLKYSDDNDDYVSPQEYKIRVGKAVRTLREELPRFFKNGLCTTSIYAPNIRLIEASHTNVKLQGKPIYFLLAGAVRWSFKMWFRDIEFEIQSIRVNDRGGRGLKGMDSGSDFDSTTAQTSSSSQSPKASHLYSGISTLNIQNGPLQSFTQGPLPLDVTCQQHHPSNTGPVMGTVDKLVDGMVGLTAETGGIGGDLPRSTTVTVRWTMKGTTRPSVVLTSSGPTPPPPSSYDGVFIYQFDDLGQINEHRIENIMPSPSPEAIQRAFAWWGWLLSRTQPAAAAAADDVETRKRLGLGFITNK
ncbi:hypothetical protein EDD21DRAFT_393462 [Dissophora ornata]|nr:hypothetical protein BGZ58_000308 [Dissophora ornata]KAI8594527.1 hypothetical protein EDD21DRAFT_393462 [Dissophora ornata]